MGASASNTVDEGVPIREMMLTLVADNRQAMRPDWVLELRRQRSSDVVSLTETLLRQNSHHRGRTRRGMPFSPQGWAAIRLDYANR